MKNGGRRKKHTKTTHLQDLLVWKSFGSQGNFVKRTWHLGTEKSGFNSSSKSCDVGQISEKMLT